MRISSSQYQAMMTQSLAQNQARITDVTQQMANGNRIQVPSDDPVDSVRLSRLKREEAAITQYRSNISAVKQRMSKNEGYLQNMVNDMQSGRDLLVWAADGSNTPQDLNSMVTSLKSLRDSLTYTANTLDQEGRYVFSGTETGTAPIADNLDGFDAAMDLLSGKVAVLGGQQNILDTIDANHANVSLSNQSAINDIGQLGVGAGAIELNGYQTALEASYKAYAKIGNMSL